MDKSGSINKTKYYFSKQTFVGADIHRQDSDSAWAPLRYCRPPQKFLRYRRPPQNFCGTADHRKTFCGTADHRRKFCGTADHRRNFCGTADHRRISAVPQTTTKSSAVPQTTAENFCGTAEHRYGAVIAKNRPGMLARKHDEAGVQNICHTVSFTKYISNRA